MNVKEFLLRMNLGSPSNGSTHQFSGPTTKGRIPLTNECIACKFSGNDEAMYQFYGCPSCVCENRYLSTSGRLFGTGSAWDDFYAGLMATGGAQLTIENLQSAINHVQNIGIADSITIPPQGDTVISVAERVDAVEYLLEQNAINTDEARGLLRTTPENFYQGIDRLQTSRIDDEVPF